MKKLLTGALTLLLFVGAAQAQTKDSSKRGHHRQEMMQKLNITADQQTQLKTIREAQKTEFKALQAQGLKGEELKAKRKELHKKYAEQVQSVYTPAQKEQMKKMRSEWKERSKDGRKFKDGKGRKHKGFGRKGDFAGQMNFTEAQKAEMKKNREESRSAFQALRNDKSLSEEQKKERMKELRKVQHEKMKSILTPEQLQKMESFKKEHKPRTK